MGMQFGGDLTIWLRKLYLTLSQVRECKQQPMIDLDVRVYLRTREIKAFTLLDFLTRSFSPSPPALCSPGLNVPPCREVAAGQGRTDRKPCRVMLCHCSQVPVSAISSQGLSLSQALLSMQWSDLQGLQPTSRIFCPVRIFTAFSLHPPAHRFPNVNSQYA